MRGVRFFPLPRKLADKRIWWNYLRRGGPNDRLTLKGLKKWHRVCSRHFVAGEPTPAHPHPTLFVYNNFKVSMSPRTSSQLISPRPAKPAPTRTNLPGPGTQPASLKMILTKVAHANGIPGPEVASYVDEPPAADGNLGSLESGNYRRLFHEYILFFFKFC